MYCRLLFDFKDIFMRLTLILQVVVSILLIVSILLQSRGEGMGVIGGGMADSHHTKRGMEKFLFQASVVLSVAFLGLSILSLIS